MSNLEESLPIFVRISEGIKDHILSGDINERRATFKERYIMATLKEAKRLRYTVEELQKMVVDAYKAYND